MEMHKKSRSFRPVRSGTYNLEPMSEPTVKDLQAKACELIDKHEMYAAMCCDNGDKEHAQDHIQIARVLRLSVTIHEATTTENANLRARLQTAEQQNASLVSELSNEQERTLRWKHETTILQTKLNSAEQQLEQVTKELEDTKQTLYETNESYEKAAHDRDVVVKDCRRLEGELGQVREEVKGLRDKLDEAWGECDPVAFPDGSTPEEVVAYVLDCASRWDPSARIIGNARAGDIKRALETLSATPSDGCGKGRTDACNAFEEWAAEVRCLNVDRDHDGDYIEDATHDLWEIFEMGFKVASSSGKEGV